MEQSTIELLNSFDKSVTYLDISDKNISGILNLHKFENLEKLICSHNKITQIIMDTSSLKYFDCSYNQIKELNYTEINSKLDYFSCKKNQLVKLFYPFNIKPKSYPKNLKELTFGIDFNQPVENLPKKLTFLKLGYNFNLPLDNLPNSLTHLVLEYEFNLPLDNLPERLIELELSYSFNHPLDSLPNSLTHLTTGYCYNFSLDNLPSNLTHLTLQNGINYPLNNLPNGLKELNFGEKLFDKVENLPESITDLTLHNMYILSLVKIPKNTTNLNIESKRYKDSEGNSYTGIYIEKLKYIFDSTDSLNLKNICFGNYFNSSGMTDFTGKMIKLDNKYLFDFSLWTNYLDKLLDCLKNSVFDKNNSEINLLIGTFSENIYDPYGYFAKDILKHECFTNMNHIQIRSYIKINIDSIKNYYEKNISKYCIDKYPNQSFTIKFIYIDY